MHTKLLSIIVVGISRKDFFKGTISNFVVWELFFIHFEFFIQT